MALNMGDSGLARSNFTDQTLLRARVHLQTAS